LLQFLSLFVYYWLSNDPPAKRLATRPISMSTKRSDTAPPIIESTKPVIANPWQVLDFLPRAEKTTPRIATTIVATAPYVVRHNIQILTIPKIKPVIAIPFPGSGCCCTYTTPG
jgi:hypothetical protein